MKTLVLSFIIFSILTLQHIVDRSNFLHVEFAFRILNIFKRDKKSFCFLSNKNEFDSSDQNYFNKILKEINSQYFGYDDELAEEDSETIIQKYVEFLENEDRCIEIMRNHLIPDNCRVYESEYNDLSKLIIDKLKLKKSDLGITTSGEMLALACKYEIFYKDLSKYSVSENRSEQLLANILIFNHFTKLKLIDLSDKAINRVLVKKAHEFMGRVLASEKLPSMNAIICLISKSFISYSKNELQNILKYYINIVNELKNNENETCELSNLKTSRRNELINILNVTGKLDEIQINGILLGFQHLFENMDDTHIYLLLDMYPQNYKYLTRECNFVQQQFLDDYQNTIQNIINNLQLESKETEYPLYLMEYCMLTNIRNYREVKDFTMLNSKLSKIIHVYNTLIYLFTESLCHDRHKTSPEMIINYLRSDSEDIYLMIKNYYLMKLIFYCKVHSYQDISVNRSYLEILHKYLYNYTLEYCPYKLSNVKKFADGISKDLFGIRDDKIISLRSIESFVSRLLDKSNDNIKVTWFNAFEYQADYCHIKEDINFSRIDFNNVNTNNHNYQSIKATIVPKCSKILSTAKFSDDFNAPVNINDLILLLETSLDLIKNVAYKSLSDNEKFNILKNSTYDRLIAYKSSQGFQFRMDCEIKTITKEGFLDMSIDILKSIYLYLASKYTDRSCLLDFSMFTKNKIPKLIAYLKLYPSINVLDNTKIIAYILNLKRSITNISNQLISSIYPDMIVSQLVDHVSCRYQKTFEELNITILNYLINKYNGTEILWVNHVNFDKCLLLKYTISYLSDLYNYDQLSPQEIKYLNNVYHTILVTHPGLNEKNENNRNKILDILINTGKLIDYISNPIKLSMVKCYIRKLPSIVIHTSSTEISSTISKQHFSTSTTRESYTTYITEPSTTSTITPNAPTIESFISLTEDTSDKYIVETSSHELDLSSIGSTTTIIDNNSITTSNNKPKLSAGAIIGIVIVYIAMILTFVGLMIYYYYITRIKK